MKLYLYVRTNKATDHRITHFTRVNIKAIETDELFIIDIRNGKTVQNVLGRLKKIEKRKLPLQGIHFEGAGPDAITEYYVTTKEITDETYQSLNKEYIDTFKALKEMNNINSQNSSFQRRDIN